jgi:hypothetical protein
VRVPERHFPTRQAGVRTATCGHMFSAGLMVVRTLEQIGGGSAGGEDLGEGGERD